MPIRNRVRTIRIEKNLTLGELARVSGVGRATIGYIELDNHIPRIDTVLRLARALDVSVKALFELVEFSDYTADEGGRSGGLQKRDYPTS